MPKRLLPRFVAFGEKIWMQWLCLPCLVWLQLSNLTKTHSVLKRLMGQVRVACDDITGQGIDGFKDEEVYPPSEERRNLASLKTFDQKAALTPEILSRRWNIGLEKAQDTLRVTTQAGVRNVLVPSERKVRKKAPWLKFPAVKGRWFTDQMFSLVESIHGDIGASVFTNGTGFDKVYPIHTKKDHSEATMHFIHDVGVPQTIVSDGAKELILGATRDIYHEYRIQSKFTVPYSPWQNLAEASIRELKKGTRRKLQSSGTPMRTWSYCMQWVTDVRQFTASSHPDLNGRTPFEHVVGSTPDISPLAMFDYWQLVYFYTPTPEFPREKKTIGRWLGLATDCTDDMAYYIVPESGIPIVRKNVWSIPDDDLKTPAIADKILAYDVAIAQKLKWESKAKKRKAGADAPEEHFPDPPEFLFEDDHEDPVEPAFPEGTAREADDYTPKELDEYLTADVMLPHGGESARAKIIGRTKDPHGNPIGLRNDNPILDTRYYDVEFPDGSTDSFTANLIAENLFSQIDDEGRSYQILKDIVGHQSNAKALQKMTLGS